MDASVEKILNDFQQAMMELRCSDCDGEGYNGTDDKGRRYSCETCGGHEDGIGDGLSRDVCWNDNPIRARLEGEEMVKRLTYCDVDERGLARSRERVLSCEWAPQWGTAMPTVQAEGIGGTWVARCPYCEVSDHRFIMPKGGTATFTCSMSAISPGPSDYMRQFYAIAPAGPAPDNPEPPSPPYLTGTRVTERPYL